MADVQQQLKERFDLLPKVVQDAITSASVEEHLRELSKTHQLHLDQWQELETEVMLALMGLKPIEALQNNIEKMVHVDSSTAQSLAQDISQVVFAPIRRELDQALVKLQAPATVGEPLPDLSNDIQKTAHPQPAPPEAAPETAVTAAADAAPPTQNPGDGVAPVAATEPPTPTAPKVIRTEVPETYKSGTVSAERKDVHSDPYREAPDA